MLKTEISKDDPLFPGDRIEMRFKFLGPNWVYVHAAELALLEWQLKRKHPYWEMTSWDSTSDPERLILEFAIKGPPFEETPEVVQASIITGAIIAAAIIGGGLFMWLSLEAVYKITESPAGKVALAGTGALGIAALVFAVLLLIRHYQE